MSQKKNQPTIANSQISFVRFLWQMENRIYLLGGVVIGILYYLICKNLFPFPNLWPDSFTYIQVARDHQLVSYRPVEYSSFIEFFKDFSKSDWALTIAQFALNILANLFLFFSFIYFFEIKKYLKFLAYALLLLNPLYVLYSNSILSDSFFNAATIIWFSLFLWLINRPNFLTILLQWVFLLFAFKLRYQGVILPAVLGFALFFIKWEWWKKALTILLSIASIYYIIDKTTDTNDEVAGTKTFSAFSGWQMANNAVHILQHQKIDNDVIDDDESVQVLKFIQNYYDTAKNPLKTDNVSPTFLWNKNSPLKKYLMFYITANQRENYFKTWQELGPIYNQFGKSVIIHNPVAYIKYFVANNAKQYFIPTTEAIETYCQNMDTISPVVKNYYEFPSNKINKSHNSIYTSFIHSQAFFFTLINVLILLVSVLFLIFKRYNTQSKLFNRILLLFWGLFSTNFIFIVLLAPTVFRYHIFILTLAIPFLIYLAQVLFTKEKNTKS